MGLILDASVLIGAERGTFDLQKLLASAADDTVAIAAITASELLHGVERARDAAKRGQRHQYVEDILDAFPAIPFGLAEARIYARLWAALAARGKMIGAHDAQVAATALSIGSAVVTLNQKEFKRLPGLTVTPVARYVRS